MFDELAAFEVGPGTDQDNEVDGAPRNLRLGRPRREAHARMLGNGPAPDRSTSIAGWNQRSSSCSASATALFDGLIRALTPTGLTKMPDPTS